MSGFRMLAARLLGLFSKSSSEKELNEELRSHLEMLTEENVRKGMPPEEARYAAVRSFGAVEPMKQIYREQRGMPSLESLWQDLRYAARGFRKNPGFTTVAVLTLALGIGANAAVFTLVDALILRAVPVASPERLVNLTIKSPQETEGLSYLDYKDLCGQARSFSGVALYYRASRSVNSLDESSQVLVDEVTPDYFRVLGVRALMGRAFSPEMDNKPQSESGVVISYRLWRGRLGGDPAIVGKEIRLTGKPATVIGVMPRFFQGMAQMVPTDIWLVSSDAVEVNPSQPAKRSGRWFQAVARLEDGVSDAQASAELEGLSRRLALAYPDTNRGRTFTIDPVVLGGRQRWLIGLISMALPGLVLLIACANLAGLLLARGETRRQEFAIRVALGAGRWHLMRQLLVEGLLLSLVGGVLALTLTDWLTRFQRTIIPAVYSFLGPDLRVDIREVAITAVISLFATLLFTLTPAFNAWNLGHGSAMKGAEAGIGKGARRTTARDALVAAQMALSVVVMTLSLLLLRSFYHVRNLPVGFDTHKNLAIMNVFGLAGMPGPQQYLPSLMDRVAGLPGVTRATYAARIPLAGSGGGISADVSIPGFDLPQGQQAIPIHMNVVGRNYFQVVGTRLLQGRDFTSADGPRSPKVAIVSQFMANHFWPHENAVGRFFKVNGNDTQIVGIAEDVKIGHILEAPEPYMYLPFMQTTRGEGALIVETTKNPEVVIPLLREQIHSYSPSLVIWHTDTLKTLLDLDTEDSLVESRVTGALSLLGIFLASMGLYGVVSYVVRSRSREVGIRLALGAGAQQVQGLFVFRGLKLALVGVAVGVAAALAAGRLAAGIIYGVSPYDPECLAASATAVLLIALLACYIPARRAAKVDPMVVLRYE